MSSFARSRRLRPFALRPSLAASIGFALSSCAVGPDHVAPALDAPDAWTERIASRLDGDPAAVHGWWRHLGDPVLADLIERADAHNRELAQAFHRVEQARAARGVATGEFLPDVDGRAAYERFRNSANGRGSNFGFPLPTEHQNITSFGLDATWEIDVFGRIRRAVEAADAELDASVEDLRDLRVVVLAEVGLAYADLRTAQERERIARENVRLQGETLGLTEARLESEIAPELDVTRARANLAQTQAEVPRFQAQAEGARHRLALLCGVAPGELDERLASASGLPEPPEGAGVGVPRDLVRDRPDVRAAERRLAAQTARIGVATADLYPRFSLTGTFGYESLDGSNVGDSENRMFAFGPSVRWNLFDGGRVRANVALEEARTEEALAAYEQTVLRVMQEVETALSDFHREQEREASLARAAEAAERSVGHARTLYDEGITDFQDVLDAERVLFSVQDALAASRGQVLASWIDLVRALGGQ